MILVDGLANHGGRWWCHMVSDTSMDELHTFAARLGIKRAWFDGDHYDLRANKRALAAYLGAVEVNSRELLKRMCGPRGARVRATLAARPAKGDDNG